MLFKESEFRGKILSKIRGEDTDLFEESTGFTHLLEKTDDNRKEKNSEKKNKFKNAIQNL